LSREEKHMKIIAEKTLGYNVDFTRIHFEHTVQLENGEIETMYSSSSANKSGPLMKTKPFVAKPQRG
jgi:hypothetical protein